MKLVIKFAMCATLDLTSSRTTTFSKNFRDSILAAPLDTINHGHAKVPAFKIVRISGKSFCGLL